MGSLCAGSAGSKHHLIKDGKVVVHVCMYMYSPYTAFLRSDNSINAFFLPQSYIAHEARWMWIKTQEAI